MNLNTFRKYCLSKKGVQEDFPFDNETLVHKVGSKMFALTNVNSQEFSIKLKCDPGLAIDLRDQYPAIEPAFHMNKKHWNMIRCDDSVPDNKIFWLIDHSYNLVYNKLTKIEKELIENSLV